MRPSNSKRLRSSTPTSSSLEYQTLEHRRLLAGDAYSICLSMPPQFPSEPGLYQVYSNYGRVGQIDLVNQTFSEAGNNAGTKVNAAGFRASDNYAYGVITSVSEIARIGSDGSIEPLGKVDGLPTDQGTYFVGDFANDDLLYIRNSVQKDMLYGVNVDTMTVDNVIATSTTLKNIYDIAFSNKQQKFYASERGTINTLISIDLDGNVERIGSNGIGKLTFGAMYADADGSIFGAANQTGEVFRFNTSTGEATLIGFGPASGTNDGFSNATKVLKLAPTAMDDSFTMDSMDSTFGNLFEDSGSGSDVDGNNDSFLISAVNGLADAVNSTIFLDSGSSLTVSERGDFIYNPSADYAFMSVSETATETFEYEITDSTGLSNTGNVTITIEGSFNVESKKTLVMTGLESFGGEKSVTVSSIGDLNGDGIDDFVHAMPSANRGAGITFVCYGQRETRNEFNVNDLRYFNGNDGSLGSIVYGIDVNDLSGFSIANAGDVNADGVADLLIGAKDADPNGRNSGESYLLFGQKNGIGAEFRLSTLQSGDGSRGMVINGMHAQDLSGSVVAGIGDINADGVDDFAISAKHADIGSDRVNAGQTYVIYGNENGFESRFELSSLAKANGGDGSRGFIINGVRKHDLAGGKVQGGIDINGDGLSDLLVTAENADPNSLIDAGQSYVLYGNRAGFGAEFELNQLMATGNADGNLGFVINGNRKFSQCGSAVDMVTDTNGDGVGELIFGKGDKQSTCVGQIFGGQNVFTAQLNMSAFDKTAVFVDNYEFQNKGERGWEHYSYSATLHSSLGTQVTIWGDPHVVISSNGNVERFDIGYGEGRVELSGGAVISWETFAPDSERFPEGPPLDWFSVDSQRDSLFVKLAIADDVESIDNLTGLTESQLLEFADILRLLEGDASEPLVQL